MATRKQTRRAPTRHKKTRSSRIPKVLLFVSYSAALVALGSIFFMKTELRRFKSPDRQRAVESVVVEKKTAAIPVNKPKSEVQAAIAPRAGEITVDEKKPRDETRTAIAPRAAETAADEKKPQSETRTAAAPSVAPHAGEITANEKKQLENILRSRGNQ